MLQECYLSSICTRSIGITIAAKFGREKYHKRPENICDSARGQGEVAWVDRPACPTEIQQKRECLQIPAQIPLSQPSLAFPPVFANSGPFEVC